MPATFPPLTSGATAKYPLIRHNKQRSDVVTFLDFSEQRWAKGTQLDVLELRFTRVSTVDKELVRAFFNARQGAYDTSWQITIEDPPSLVRGVGTQTTYEYMQFLPGQQFHAVEEVTGYWTFSLTCRRTRAS